MPQYKADMGGVAVDLGIDQDLAGYAREIGRVESRLLWADKQGMEFPPYILKALRESVELYHERLQRGPVLHLTGSTARRQRRSVSNSPSSRGRSTKANRMAESLQPYGITRVSPCRSAPQE